MFNAFLDKENMPPLLLRVLLTVFFFRVALAAWLPMTGDEAYFIVWGKNLDYGYYDHTPFVGWLLATLLSVSDAAWWLRMPSVLLPIAISYGIYRILLPRLPQVAAWVALAYLVAPVNLINVLITTDTPLIFFSFVSAWFFYLALYESKSNKDFLLAGLFLGLAFFSKYFAVLLGFSYGFYIVLFHRERKNLIGLSLILLMVAPFVGLNLLWNYNHCWNNILFNLFNRTAGADDSLISLVKYIGMLVYLFSPVLIFYLIKNKAIVKMRWSENIYRVYTWLAFFPLALFLLLLLRKEIGLHWVLSFYPFAFIALAGVLNVKQWRWTFHFMWAFSLIHVFAVSSIMLLPVETFANKKEAVENLIFGKYPEEVLEKLKPYEKDYTFATISYGMSSVLSYYSNKHVIVFDKASFHAREDERLTDYKSLDGKNILIFKRTALNLDKLKRYFAHAERKSFKVREATYELLIGQEFNYQLYHKEILQKINKDFYAIPDWLPVGQCEFKEKYGFGGK
ncbi:MAG: glycosyltransferase family 39 protein [Gammaproteobacteria bacterium]|nr:glycosyltransferase family 39 protein [Gammaproteobacteria bacterium]MCW8987013.1 glycosyltransferase family 39 protein [Gammaproteobacteria bacterium]MCW9030415.1 glycosyltransferase family 39 protein [Gammaproteobacteria bacterium]